ncbi:MAG: hypothetical protein E7271_12230 [Lachnospiraceae bacterium]|jgi:uncharacterized repeat protein (TIGR02543 family)|nr:hypothetical protein [Lachnospiraceae bacterium]
MKTKKISKRIISLILIFAMVLGAVPLPFTPGTMVAYADDSVAYIDADGKTKTISDYTVLTGEEQEIGKGDTEKWYVVNSDIHFDEPLVLKGNVNIILVDGKNVTFGSENNRIGSSYCILSGYDNLSTGKPHLYDLKIFGQAGGTGALTIYEESKKNYETEPESVSIYVDEYYQYGGKVTIDNTGNYGNCLNTYTSFNLNKGNLSLISAGKYAINAEIATITNAKVTAKATGENGCAIKSKYNIGITNSEVTAEATGAGGCAIYTSDAGINITDSKVTATGEGGIKTYTGNNAGFVKLSLSGSDHFVQASNYVANIVYVMAGKHLTDNTGNLYGGREITALTSGQVTAIAGKKLVPAYGVGTDNMLHGTITASPNAFSKDAFGNLSDAGRTVTLTITPEASYTLSSLTVTKAGGGTVDISGSGNTRTFTMPAESVLVSAMFEQPAVAYLDASGTEQSCTSYTALTGGEATTLAAGWYVVQKNTCATYTGRLTLDGNVNLILEDGAKLLVGEENSPVSGRGINSNTNTLNQGYGYNLTIYGQSTDKNTAGTLYVYSNNSSDEEYSGIKLEQNSVLTLNGGNVEVHRTGNKGYGIYSYDFVMNGGDLQVNSKNEAGIYVYNGITINGGTLSTSGGSTGHGLRAENGSITINGGSVTAIVKDPGSMKHSPAIITAKGSQSIIINGGKVTANTGIQANGGSIILGFSDADDSIEAESYSTMSGGDIRVAEGKCFCIAGNETKVYSGTLTSDQLTAIANKKLYPAYGVFIGTVRNGTVSASCEAFAMTDFDSAYKNVTLTVTPDTGFTIGSVIYNDGSDHTITPVNGEYSFTMPARDVNVTVTFLKSLDYSDITIDSIADQTYTGSTITPAVIVKDGDTTLEQGTDYTVSYSNNINAGKAAVTITGQGSYSGEITRNFTITQKAVTITANDQSIELGASIATGTDKVSVTGEGLVSGHRLSAVTLSTENPGTVVGEYVDAIVPSAAKIMSGMTDVTANYAITYVNGKLSVTKIKARVTNLPKEKTGFVYDGETHELITAGEADTGMEYALGENATTAPTGGYSENVPNAADAKNYYVWYRAKADDNHEAGDADVLTVKIAKANPSIATRPTASPISYGQTLANSNLTNGAAKLGEMPVAGSFAWSDETIAPVVSNSNTTTYTVIFTPTDSANINETSCELTLTVNKADIPAEKITPPTANSLTYTGSAQELINPGAVSDGLGTMKYAFAKVLDTDNPPAAPTEEAAYNSSVPTAIKGGEYYVWYMVKGDANHKDKTPASVKVTISKEHIKSEIMKTIEVQAGSDVPVSVNLKAYLGENASTSEITTGENQTGTLTFSDVAMGLDKYTLSFKVTSEPGGCGSIILRAQTENHQTYCLTIPVEAKAITTEVKLEEAPGVDSAVEGVVVSGLDTYTDEQSGTTVKVELDVKTESEESVNPTVAANITSAIAQIFSSVESTLVKKEYLDISVKKNVGEGNAETVSDVGRPIELAVKYDLSGKFNPVVLREHGGAVRAFEALAEKPSQEDFRDATFYVDRTTWIIYIYTEFFSTYSIAYATTASYTVKFDAQGGSAVDDRIVTEGGTIGTLPDSTRSGYTLVGWFTKTTGGTKLTTSTVINADTIYYAQWKQNSSGGGTPAKTSDSGSEIDSGANNESNSSEDGTTEDSTDSNNSTAVVSNVKTPSKVKIKSAKNNKKKTVTVKWKKINGVKEYEVQYALNKKFSKGKKTKVVKSSQKSSLSIKKLKKGKTYYVRVRAYALDGNKKVYGAWSSKKKITIKK